MDGNLNMSYDRDFQSHHDYETEEIWKKVGGYKYDYEVSNYGRFRCLDSFFHSKRNVITNGYKDVNGYLRVSLTSQKGTKSIKLHRLVAQCFLKDYSEHLTVNHKNFDKTDNKVSNLEMMTFSDNTHHFIQNIRKKKSTSKVVGVCFHKGIGKWTARVKHKGKRYSVGTYNTEEEAINAVINYTENDFIIGKGASLVGKSKYSEKDDIDALMLSKKIGVRKAGRITGMGSSRICNLKKRYKYINGTFIKNEK